LKDGPGKGVQANFRIEIRPRMKGNVVDPRISNREENRLAEWGIPGTGPHDKRLWGAVYYHPWTEENVHVKEQVEGIPGRVPFNWNICLAEMWSELGKGSGSFRCILLYSRKESRQPKCVTHMGDVCDDVRNLAGSLRRGRNLIGLVDIEENEKRHLDDVRWRRVDGGGEGEQKSPLVEESLVVAKCKPGLLRDGGAEGVVHGRGKREKQGHLPHRENESAAIEHRVLVAECIAEN
jgi:hypothetical protein